MADGRDTLGEATGLGGAIALGDGGVPTTIGAPQRAAGVEARLFRGSGVHHPDTALDHGVVGDLLVRAASVRGTYARYNGSARQDDYAMGCSEDGRRIVLAVADGLSNADASHLGATLAVRTAVQQIVRQMDEGHQAPDLQGVFQSAAYQLQRAAEQMVERGQLEEDGGSGSAGGALATTLLVAVLPTDADFNGCVEVRMARVGDSNAWLVDDAGWTPLLDAKDDGRTISTSTVRALPALPDQVDEASVIVPSDATLVLASDGVTDPFGAEGAGEVARALAGGLHPRLPSILEFARMIAFRGQSWDDDRTAIAVRAVTAADHLSQVGIG